MDRARGDSRDKDCGNWARKKPATQVRMLIVDGRRKEYLSAPFATPTIVVNVASTQFKDVPGFKPPRVRQFVAIAV